MAREVAVDVASHSPQVDPILASLAGELAELSPTQATIPHYSATRPDPREVPACDAAYWVDNLRQMVRFSAAVQAALEDGYRVFAELSPHPLLTRAVEQTAQSIETPVAALAGLRRDQPLPHGLLGFVADLHAAGAAVDFAALYPAGRLMDVPLPSWTHHHLLLDRGDGAGKTTSSRRTPCSVPTSDSSRSPNGTPGSPTSVPPPCPGWPTTGSTTWPPFPAPPTARWRIVAAEQLFPAGSEVRDVRFEDLLLLDDHTELTAVAALDAPGRRRVQRAHRRRRGTSGARRRHAALRRDRPAGPSRRRRTARGAPEHSERQRYSADTRRTRYRVRPRVHRSGQRAHRRADATTLLGEVTAPAGIRAQQSGYAIHPAVLDACFQTVGAHFLADGASDGALMLPLSVGSLRRFGSGRDARYCHATIAKADATEIEAEPRNPRRARRRRPRGHRAADGHRHHQGRRT